MTLLLDVLCTGRFLSEFLSAFPSPESVDVIALVDARLGTQRYFSYQSEKRTFDIPVASIIRHHVETLTDRPASIRPRDVFIIDSKTHAPTRYVLPDEPKPDDEGEAVTLEKLASGNALSIGHYSWRDRHYLFRSPFEKAFRALHSDISKWLVSEYNELITITPGLRVDTMQIFCLDEESGLFQTAAEALRGENVSTVTLLTRADIEAPPADVQSSSDLVWCIMPSAVSGKTIEQTLDFACRLTSKRIRLSVIISRLDHETEHFYGGLQQYKEKRIEIHFRFAINLLWFNSINCPLCARANILQACIEHLGPEHVELLSLLELTFKRERVEELSSASAGPRSGSGDGDLTPAQEAHLLSLYSQASRDIECRTALKEELSREGNVDVLATTAGRLSCWEGFKEPERSAVLALVILLPSWGVG